MGVRRWRARCAAGLGAGLTALQLAGCAGPSWTYVTNSADKTYLKVPTTWHQVDPAALRGKLGIDSTNQAGMWTTAYDASATPSVDHLFGNTTDAPIAFVFVRSLPESARGQYSLDRLRDLINPVSPSAQQQAATTPSGDGTVTTISDEVLSPGKGVHGVHVIYGKQSASGTPQVYDQIGYVNDDASMLYLFVAQCSLQCFQQRQSEITNVVSSFTVREKP